MTGRDGGEPSRGTGSFPAFGPVEAVLSYVLFYVLVDRVTPSVLAVAADVAALPPSLVGLGLAGLLWLVLLVNLLEQTRRQLAALDGVEVREPTLGLQSALSGRDGTAAALALIVLGGVVAALSFEAAVDFLVALIRLGTATDFAALSPSGALLVVVFFVGYGVAARALDYLLVAAVRRI